MAVFNEPDMNAYFCYLDKSVIIIFLTGSVLFISIILRDPWVHVFTPFLQVLFPAQGTLSLQMAAMLNLSTIFQLFVVSPLLHMLNLIRLWLLAP
jgi:hypothetical protein